MMGRVGSGAPASSKCPVMVVVVVATLLGGRRPLVGEGLTVVGAMVVVKKELKWWLGSI